MKRLMLLSLLLASSSQAVSLVSRVTGNFTSAGTWGTVDATSLLDSEAGSTACTTSQVNSSNFTPGVITNDGVAVKLAARVASPTGTITITLRNTTAGSDLVSTTVNVSQLPSSGNGWQFFKWGSSQVLLAATNYAVGFTCSVNAEVTLFRNGTAGNWSRMLSTTTTAAPGANDLLYIMGELTGAGTGNDITVTMDQTATTSFGTTTPPQSFATSNRGILTWGTTASTIYKLAHAGVFACYGGSTVNFGTSGTRMPSTSSGTWTATVASNVDSGWIMGSGCTLNTYGVAKTRWTYLTADAAASATTLTVTSTTGWLAGDTLLITSTTRTSSQTETKVIQTVDSSTGVTLTAGLTNAHSGTSPTRAEVGNITSNVRFTGTSGSLQGYVRVDATATYTGVDTEFQFLGSATANKEGITVNTTTGSFSLDNSSVHDANVNSSMGIKWNTSANLLQTSGTFSLTNSIIYKIDAYNLYCVAATTNTTYVVSGNLFSTQVQTGDSPIVFANDIGGTWTNNTIASGNYGWLFEETNAIIGTISGNSTHSVSVSGYLIRVGMNGTITGGSVWRTGSHCIDIRPIIGIASNNPGPWVFDSFTFFGCASSGINFQASDTPILVSNSSFSGDTTFSTAAGIVATNNIALKLKILNSTFGVASGIRTAHTTGDLNISNNSYVAVDANYSTFASTTVVAGLTTVALSGSYVAVTGFGQVATTHKYYNPFGIASTDTVIFRTASPSQRMTPNNASQKFVAGLMYIPIVNGTSTATLSAWVRKSVVGDSGGANYNGATPRLIVQVNPSAGSSYNSDYVCASGGGSGSYAQLTCALPAVTADAMLVAYIDCDGTAGWINVSDVAVTTTATSLGNPLYFDRGFMSVTSGASGTAGGSSAINMRKGMQ